jgi:hypothetical protein
MIAEDKRKDIGAVLRMIAATCEEWGRSPKPSPDGHPEPRPGEPFLKVATLAREEAANIEEPFRLGVVGMFKSGKSSVINTFLQRKILQEGRTETTSVLTELRFAETPEDEKGIVVRTDNQRQEVSVAEALEYTDIRSAKYKSLGPEEKRREQASISRIILHLHVELLRTVNLLDTPGFGGSPVGDRKALEALHNVDAALMVFSADRTGASTEVEIADALNRAGREIVALLNKVDDGRGGMLSEKQLAAPESFLREHFRKIVTGSDGRPLIFRYSALEVWKALETLQRPDLPNEEASAALEALGRWGYQGRGGSERERGVVHFIRERYFSSASDSYERKLRGARTSVQSALESLLGALERDQADAERSEREKSSLQSERLARQEAELDLKIKEIERELDDVIAEGLQPFLRDVEQAMAEVTGKLGAIDLLLQVFKSEEAIARELEKQFRARFPEWRQQEFMEKLEGRIQRLLRREWKLVMNDLQGIEVSMELPEMSGLLDDVNKSVRKFAVSAGVTIAGFVALIFVPGGQIVLLIKLLLSVSQGLGAYYAGKADNEVADTRHKIRIRLENHGIKMKQEIKREAQRINDRMADSSRSAVRAEMAEIDRQAVAYRELGDWLRRAARDAGSGLAALEELRIEGEDRPVS